MPSVAVFRCNRQNMWRTHQDISSIVVRVTYLVDHGLCTASSPQFLVWFHSTLHNFDTKSFTVSTNVFLGKFVNGFYANNETITYNTDNCPVLMGVGRI